MVSPGLVVADADTVVAFLEEFVAIIWFDEEKVSQAREHFERMFFGCKHWIIVHHNSL